MAVDCVASGCSDILRFCAISEDRMDPEGRLSVVLSGRGGLVVTADGTDGTGGGEDAFDSRLLSIRETLCRLGSLRTAVKLFLGDGLVEPGEFLPVTGDSSITANFGVPGDMLSTGGKVPDFCKARGTPDRLQFMLYDASDRGFGFCGDVRSPVSAIASFNGLSVAGDPATELGWEFAAGEDNVPACEVCEVRTLLLSLLRMLLS